VVARDLVMTQVTHTCAYIGFGVVLTLSLEVTLLTKEKQHLISRTTRMHIKRRKHSRHNINELLVEKALCLINAMDNLR
jgi:hypothetical protein